MLAVQYSFKDQSSILDKLEEIKVRLSEQQNISEEDVIEWQQLCDWLKKDNFSFFGYCSFSRKNQSPTKPLNSKNFPDWEFQAIRI